MVDNFWDKSRTQVRFPHAPFTHTVHGHTGFFGSCFADELSRRYNELELSCFTSPFGIIYNPLSLGQGLTSLLDRSLSSQPFLQNSRWKHFAFHSSCALDGENSEDPIELKKAENHYSNLINNGTDKLESLDTLVITLGTAWAYRLKESGQVVNNCHRCDSRLFERDIYQKWVNKDEPGTLEYSINRLIQKKPTLNVILTVSPVRHLRDDARENSYSKALLRCLCEDLSNSCENIHYFPAYEILLDELRDYRWYKDDLCHPSPRAVDYIMHRFFEWGGDQNFLNELELRRKELKRRNHRPLGN
jgi:hypothetical protein